MKKRKHKQEMLPEIKLPSPEEIMRDQDFGEWAFGPAMERFKEGEGRFYDLMQAWNYRHGKLMRLFPGGSYRDDLKAMYELYYYRIKD